MALAAGEGLGMAGEVGKRASDRGVALAVPRVTLHLKPSLVFLRQGHCILKRLRLEHLHVGAHWVAKAGREDVHLLLLGDAITMGQ